MIYCVDEVTSISFESAFLTEDLFEEDDGYGFFIDTDGEESEEDNLSSCESLDLEDRSDTEEIKVQVQDEPAECLESNPRILTPHMMQQLVDQGLPPSCQHKEWTRIYSAARDGDRFWTFLRKVRGHINTVVVAKTGQGGIMGGYADSQWARRKKGSSGNLDIYGEGKSFLFAVDGGLSDGPSTASPMKAKIGSCDMSVSTFEESCRSGLVTVYESEGRDCYQICNAEDRRIAICSKADDDGSFGLCIQDHFCRGSTGPLCANSATEQMENENQFDVVDFEVYGFSERSS